MNAPRLLVTRPLERQEPFSTRARELGFDTVPFPCVRIVFDATAEMPSAEELEAADRVLFTSRSAVEAVAGRAPFPWTVASVVAIGRATAKALIDQGQTLAQAPVAPYTSEALLDRWKQSTAFEQIIVFKGRGGRTLLIDSLRQRGTVVTTVDLYRREHPCIDDAVRHGMLIKRRPDIIAVTSDEILENLVVLAGDALPALLPLPLVVNSDRCRTLARSCGFTGSIRVAVTAGDEGQLAALDDWLKTRSGAST